MAPADHDVTRGFRLEPPDELGKNERPVGRRDDEGVDARSKRDIDRCDVHELGTTRKRLTERNDDERFAVHELTAVSVSQARPSSPGMDRYAPPRPPNTCSSNSQGRSTTA